MGATLYRIRDETPTDLRVGKRSQRLTMPQAISDERGASVVIVAHWVDKHE